MKIVQTTLRIPEDMQASIKEQAEHMGHTANALILIILRDWLDRKAGK